MDARWSCRGAAVPALVSQREEWAMGSEGTTV